jgi:pimeloyl-ACP methyl ester carboxylesterase
MRRVNLTGPGPSRGPFLLVPGSDLGAEFYRSLGEKLAGAGFVVRLLTLPVIGSWEELLEILSKEIASFFDHSGTLAGHSLGGLIALLLAAREAERVSELVLLEPAIVPSRTVAGWAARRYRRDVVEAERDAFVNWSGSFRRIHDLDRFPREMIEHYRTMRREIDPRFTCELLESVPALYPLPFDRVRARTLVLRGASSGVLARTNARCIARKIKGATLETIPSAAHWLANEADDAVAAAIVRFAR